MADCRLRRGDGGEKTAIGRRCRTARQRPDDGGRETGHHAGMSRVFGGIGALLGLVGVVLAALAGHLWSAQMLADDLRRLTLAVTFLVLHALALVVLAVLARQSRALLLTLCGLAWIVGSVLFCGSVAGRAVYGWSSALAPFGGVMLMAGWLLLSVWFFFARR
jgi:uncharacterized membrane protein YgdD (TMEM256/DUF423 family)